jgi:hypothetical protein
MPSECPGNIRDQDVRNVAVRRRRRRLACGGLPSRPPSQRSWSQSSGSAWPCPATLVAAGGTAFIFIRGPESIGPDIAALLTVGFAGVALGCDFHR